MNHTWQAAYRSQFPIVQRIAFFQNGSLAPLSHPVREALFEASRIQGDLMLADPHAAAELYQRAEETRKALASLLRVAPEEIGWTSNTSKAVRYGVHSIRWQPGDVLITTSLEHISTRALRDGLAQQYGVRNVVVAAERGDEAFLSDLDRALAQEKGARLLILSHVSTLDGRRLPIKEASRLAHAHGVPVLVDGSQAVGQFPVDVADAGCDFYAGSGHKWLMGPLGVGYLVVRRWRWDRFHPEPILHTQRTPLGDVPLAPQPLSAKMAIEFGTENVALRVALGVSLSMLQDIGLANVEHYVAGLVTRLREGVRHMPGLTVLTPDGEGRASGILSLALAAKALDAVQRVVDGLHRGWNVVVKVQPEQPAIRVSVAAYNTAEEIDRLLAGLEMLVAKAQNVGQGVTSR